MGVIIGCGNRSNVGIDIVTLLRSKRHQLQGNKGDIPNSERLPMPFSTRRPIADCT
jgi:hypothetical protein